MTIYRECFYCQGDPVTLDRQTLLYACPRCYGYPWIILGFSLNEARRALRNLEPKP